MKQFHCVYLTTNLINGKQYVGDHSTDDLNDGYLGSGKYLVKAFFKYGKSNFKKEILEQFNTKEEAFIAQEKYIQQHNTLNPNGYNLSPKGGLRVMGCFSKEILKRKNESLRGYKHTMESRNNMSNGKKKLYSNKINHPRTKIFIIHNPKNEKILCVGTFRIFRDKNRANYNKYFKEIIKNDKPINGWYFKEFKKIEDISNINEYKLFKA
jgi:hypothetical protein